MFNPERVLHVDATQSQYIPAGELLGKMFYGNFLDSVLKREEYSGYPHNGGEHSLCLKMTKEDALAFVEVVKERYKDHPGCEAFTRRILLNLEKEVKRFT